MTLTDTDNYAIKFGLSLLCVTVPTAIFRKIAYFLFVAPCLIRDQSKTSDCKDCFLNTCTSVFAGFGYLTACVWGLAFFIGGLGLWLLHAESIVSFYDWMGSILQFWVIWFVAAFLFDFNPFPKSCEYFKFLNCLIQKLACGILPIRVGRWHLERALVHGVIREKVAERGVTRFFLPDAQHTDAESLRTAATSDVAKASNELELATDADLDDPDGDGVDTAETVARAAKKLVRYLIFHGPLHHARSFQGGPAAASTVVSHLLAFFLPCVNSDDVE